MRKGAVRRGGDCSFSHDMMKSHGKISLCMEDHLVIYILLMLVK